MKSLALLASVLGVTAPSMDEAGNAVKSLDGYRVYCAKPAFRRELIVQLPGGLVTKERISYDLLKNLELGLYLCHVTAVRGSTESRPSNTVQIEITPLTYLKRLFENE